MVPDHHYLDVSPDLSNLVETCEEAIRDQKTTLQIAKNGYDLYKEYYQLLPDGGMTDLMWGDIVQQLRKVGVSI